jgi:sulfopyruvate decarboxylase subunit alpha/phosphonopyruvate decarboxylase
MVSLVQSGLRPLRGFRMLNVAKRPQPHSFDSPMFSSSEILAELTQIGISHVVWVPDSVIGRWEHALDASPDVKLVRVCREGEAWPLAAGLLVGGKSPLVVMQTTGLFESGDALRNVLFDLKLPLFALIGARNWLDPNSNDSARRFAEPILRAWGLDYVVLESTADKPKFAEHFQHCRRVGKAGAVVLAE